MQKDHFKILAPFTTINDIRILKNAGADELYCGYVTKDLKNRWPLAFNILNRRGEEGSFDNYSIFKKAVLEAERLKLPVYVTVNGLYVAQQYPLLLKLIHTLQSLSGVKGIIVADIGLILFLKNKFNKEIHISTIAGCFNSFAADFYKELGAQRVILDRQLTAKEIAKIISEVKTDIDVEIFIIRENCGGFIDSLCTFLHCSEQLELKAKKVKNRIFLTRAYDTQMCSGGCNYYFKELLENKFEAFDSASGARKLLSLQYDVNKNKGFGCRMCDLYDLKDFRIKSLKIVGRGQDSKETSKLVRLLSQVLKSLYKTDISKSEFRVRCKSMFSNVVFNGEKQCSKFDCYLHSSFIKHE